MPLLTNTPPADSPRSPSGLPRRSVLAVVALAIVTIVAYWNSLRGGFLFDDREGIIENATLRQLWPLSVPLSPPVGATVTGRPLANLTFALNYALHGLEVWGYHVANIAIHFAAALALFGLVRRTLLLPSLRERWGSVASGVGFFATVLWAVHPVQTESVTYIVQRVESLMGCFYLLTLYGYVRAVTEPNRRRWSVLCVGACVLGMATKEVTASAPVIALLYDRTFVSGSFREAWRRHRALLLGLAATWLPLAYFVFSGGGNRGGSVGFGTGIGVWDYWLTQPRALVTYLRLTAWPHPLLFDYGAHWTKGVADVLPFALVMVPLAGATAFGFWRAPKLAFFGLWCAAILAPTSLMPGISQLTVEHRMYLPLAAAIVLAGLALVTCLGRRAVILAALLIVPLAALTARRNLDYRDAVTMWQDTVAKSPTSPLAQNNLGSSLEAVGRLPEALPHYEAATTIAPGVGDFHANFGSALLAAGRHEEASRELAEAVRLLPNHADAHNNLAMALIALDRLADAIPHYERAVALEPSNASFHYNLGTGLLRAGRVDDAAAQFREAIRLKPNDPLAHHDLGAAWAQQGRFEEALPEFEAAVRLAPDDARARSNLATVLVRLGRPDDAMREFEAVVRRAPENRTARLALGSLLLATGRAREALTQLQAVVEAAPADATAQRLLGDAYQQSGDTQNAIRAYEAAARLDPSDTTAREALSRLRTNGVRRK